MEKEFKVIGITPNEEKDWFLLSMVDSNNSSDIRYLHLEPRGELQDIGAGIEMNPERTTIYSGPGYSLREKHSKPVIQWGAGDIIVEQYYGEDFDRRENK